MKKSSSQNLLAVALVAAAGAFLGTSAVTGFVANDVAFRYEERPSTRAEFGTVDRDSDATLRIQERRNDRLRAEQEAASHAAAPDEEVNVVDVRARYRAHRWCVMNGYSHSRRLQACVEAIVSDGEYHIDY